MIFINQEKINDIQVLNFPNQEDIITYKNFISIIINNICNLLYNHNITYDYNNIQKKIKTLKIICRNGISPEYDDELNIIYIALFNQLNAPLLDEKIIIELIHETIHFLCPRISNDSISDKYYAFEEFFTEYLTFYILRRIGGIKLENFYKKNVGGYFNQDDHEIIERLIDKVSFNKLLETYFSNRASTLEDVLKEKLLISMQNYFIYFESIYEKNKLPLNQLNKKLETELITQRINLDTKKLQIFENINKLESSKQYY